MDFSIFPTEFESAEKQCIQDIPIRPVPRVEWSDIAEPTYEVDDYNFVSFVIPDLKRFKHLTDRYKNLDTYVKFEVFHNGEMEMQLLSDRVTLSTHFKNLEVVKNQGAVIEEDAEPVVVNVELKKLALFLGADTFSSKRVMASFVNEKLLHLDFINDNIAMNLYLPAVQI